LSLRNSLLAICPNVSKKEEDKTYEFLLFVEQHFALHKYKQVYDLCCGKGLLGAAIAQTGQRVVCVDKKLGAKRVSKSGSGYLLIQGDLWRDWRLKEKSLVLAIHSCGTLTDRVIELALQTENDFAILSCCHSDKIYFTPKYFPPATLIREHGRGQYLDRVRLNYIREQGLKGGISKINPRITPKNRIMWGIH